MIKFTPLHSWAMVPTKEKIDPAPAKDEARLFADHMRWLRKGRAQELCMPWRIAHEIGYVIRSPFTFELDTFTEFELAADLPPDELEDFVRWSGVNQIWNRGRFKIGVTGGEWMRLHDCKTESGFVSPFYPNGDGTVEWALGFEVDLPEEIMLLIQPYHETPTDFSIPAGILGFKTLAHFRKQSTMGFPIAIRPLCRAIIRRGDPLARIIPINQQSLKL